MPEFDVGCQVIYLPGEPDDTTRRLCRRGVVAGTPVFDPGTDTTWVPVQVDGKPGDQDPDWVRADTVVDVRTPQRAEPGAHG
ncbi:hypothetical protein [Amycolatopsis thermophila]|uniref:Uncharacterized protein n=1 Tax=Amycolatopsis thermophila TaxID=206084 RepID=A0ABU0F642_9PSEU|nr:hypothetical protein [Amycolatopsis thermophila]MDQ0383058.1 hypothetical protein [Amycolatopsis thermophila]